MQAQINLYILGRSKRTHPCTFTIISYRYMGYVQSTSYIYPRVCSLHPQERIDHLVVDFARNGHEAAKVWSRVGGMADVAVPAGQEAVAFIPDDLPGGSGAPWCPAVPRGAPSWQRGNADVSAGLLYIV